jgi:hypothetical protein
MGKDKKLKVKKKEEIVSKTLTFKICDIEYENHIPMRKVYLGDKVIYKIDCTILAGMCMQDQSKQVMDAISKVIKRTITQEEFRRIKLFGIVEI